MENLKITAEQASKMLGISPERIRATMRSEINIKLEDKTLPIGQARKVVGGRYRKQTFRYDIFLPRVLGYMGLKELPEEMKEVI